MLPLLLVASTLIADCFAGEVELLAYKPKTNFGQYRTNEKNKNQIVIMSTKQGHKFSLGINYYRNRDYGGRRVFRSSSEKTYEYQNIVEVYYDTYLLDTVKVPSIDSCDCTISDIDDDIQNSILPVPPETDTDTPSQIRVYYSFTDGDCVLGVYSFTNSFGKYYLKAYPYEVVNQNNCE